MSQLKIHTISVYGNDPYGNDPIVTSMTNELHNNLSLIADMLVLNWAYTFEDVASTDVPESSSAQVTIKPSDKLEADITDQDYVMALSIGFNDDYREYSMMAIASAIRNYLENNSIGQSVG